MIEFLKGKKTYIIATATFVLGGLTALGVAVPPWAYSLLAAGGLTSLRAGMNRSETTSSGNHTEH